MRTRIAERVGQKRFEDCNRADIETLMRYVNTSGGSGVHSRNSLVIEISRLGRFPAL